MNKKELNNIKNLIKTEATSYYYTDNYNTLKGIELTCKVIEYKEYYNDVNSIILRELKENRIIDYMIYSNIKDLIESVNDYFSINEVIFEKNLKTFLNTLELLNDEIEYINNDSYKANVNKLKVIYEGLNK